ncbi:MAG: hypothetical protein RLZZ524_1046 [Pseudomonadota bacterium]|jgi:hypothetical protein
MHTGRVELRVEVPADELAILDGYCQARGKDRTAVVRDMLREWSIGKLHEATLICRVARVNPIAPDSDRHE